MSKHYGTEDEYPSKNNPSPSPPPGEDASARKIIADYLDQVKARLPSDVAAEVIPELRSHLLEQASQPSGHLTSAAAWDAIVSMGSPDIVAREFRREKEQHEIQQVQNFLDALTPQFRQYFWWIIIGIIIADLTLIAYLTSVVLINMSVIPITLLLPYILLGVSAQVWAIAGVIISYLVMLVLSHPHGPPLAELLRSLMQEHETKEKRIPRTQRRVQKRVKKYNRLTGRGSLMGALVANIVGITVAVVFALILPTWIPSYPTFEIQVLYWLAFIGLTQAGLTVIRILVGDSSLATARLLASIDVLYGLVGLWILTLIFYGSLSFPVPIWNAGIWTLFYWKPYLMLISWLAPIIILLVIVGIIIELVQVNVYIQPLHNGYTVQMDEFD